MFIKSTVAQELGSFIQGGGQQRKLRGGTYNIPGIVGMAKAMEINLRKVDVNTENYLLLREALEKRLSANRRNDDQRFGRRAFAQYGQYFFFSCGR